MNRVLVLGVPRGGTTWVGQVLGRTAGSVYVHEPDGTTDPFSYRAKLPLHFHPILAPDAESSDYERLWQGAFAGGARSRSLRARISQRVFRRVTGAQKAEAKRSGRFTPRLWLAYHTAVPRVPVAAENVVAKSVHATLCAEWITSRWSPRVVVVFRDPRNVLASWLSFGWNTPSGPLYTAMTELASQRWGVELPPNDAETLARATATCAVFTLALRDCLRRNADWLQVTHEDLCADPVGRFRDLASALGLTWSPEAEDYVVESDRPGNGYQTKRVAGEQADRWRERLSAEQLDVIASVLERFPSPLWDPSPPR